MALTIEEKYDEVRQLITIGKEKGYLLYDEVNDLLPSEIGSSDELDDIFSMFGSMGIEMVDSEQKIREKSEGEEGVELDLTPGTLDKTNDPVRMYLREMGTVPLLTREGEVEIAKRIERGKNAMLRAISRTNMAAQEVARLGERLGAREIGVRDAVIVNEEEVTEEKLEAKIRATLKLIGKANDAHQEYLAYRKHFVKLEKKSRSFVKGKWRLARLRIRMSLSIRRIDFAEAFKRRLVRARARGRRPHPRRRGPHRAARAQAPARRERRLPQAGPPDDPGPEADAGPDPGGVRRPPRGDQALARHRHHGRGAGRAGQERAGRGQPAAGGLDRQEVHEPRAAVPGPDPGGQHRPDEGGRQVRVPARLQVLDLRDVVDPPGDHARDRRPGAHDPHPGAHDRDDQQADPHLARAGAGARPRADLGRDREADGHPGRQGAQGAEDRAGADLARDADRRGGRLPSRGLHRGPRRGLAGRGRDQPEPQGADRRGAEDADARARRR